jgi:hypothetical protein
VDALARYGVRERGAAQLRIGPLSSTHDVLALHRLDRQALDYRVHSGRIVEITFADGSR